MKHELENLQIYTYPNALADAASQYRTLMKAVDPDPWLHYNYAQLLNEIHDWEGASEQLQVFLRYLPQYMPAYEKLAWLLILRGKFEEAIEHCERALQIDPRFQDNEKESDNHEHQHVFQQLLENTDGLPAAPFIAPAHQRSEDQKPKSQNDFRDGDFQDSRDILEDGGSERILWKLPDHRCQKDIQTPK